MRFITVKTYEELKKLFLAANKKFLNDNASLLKKVKALQPDLIVLTGDIVDNSHHTNIDKAVLFTNQVQQIAQTYYITGKNT